MGASSNVKGELNNTGKQTRYVEGIRWFCDVLAVGEKVIRTRTVSAWKQMC